MELYTADWIIPIATEPLRDGAVLADSGRILFVGSRGQAEFLPESRSALRTDLGKAVILPGLVNVHTHLELTAFRGYVEDLGFRDWITKVTRTRAERFAEEDLFRSALLGAAEAIRSGITTVADTGDSGGPFDALRASGLRGIAYREVFGADPKDAETSLSGLRAKVDQMRQAETPLVRVGVSPHAPYTVSAKLFAATAEYAVADGLDVCIHTAESEAEQLLMLRGEGDFAERLRARSIPWETPGKSTISYLNDLGVLQCSPLLVHCVRADDRDISLISASRSRVAHCPRSNAKLGHGIAPFASFVAAGIKLGIGTDSVASNNRCDLLGEAGFAALLSRSITQSFDHPTARDMLRLATLGGAEVLGLESEIGTLEPGKAADLVAVSLNGAHNQPVSEPEAALVFSALPSDVILTVIAGNVLHSSKSPLPSPILESL